MLEYLAGVYSVKNILMTGEQYDYSVEAQLEQASNSVNGFVIVFYKKVIKGMTHILKQFVFVRNKTTEQMSTEALGKYNETFQPDPNLRRIVCAAYRNKAGTVICSARHSDELMRQQINALGGRDAWIGCEQGFIDQFCMFHNRKDAHKIASYHNQIFRCCGDDDDDDDDETLYSENLY